MNLGQIEEISTANSSKELSPHIVICKEELPENLLTYHENLSQTESEIKIKGVRSSKTPKTEELSFSTNIVKNSIQGIITPVVQISYSQIKNIKDSGGSIEKGNYKPGQPLSSQRSNRLDLLQTVTSLNKALSRKARSDARVES